MELEVTKTTWPNIFQHPNERIQGAALSQVRRRTVWQKGLCITFIIPQLKKSILFSSHK